MRHKLNDRFVDTVKLPAEGYVEYFDQVVPGLCFRVGHGGKKSYSVLTRISGQQVRRPIGSTASHKLAEARAEARTILEAAGKGVDIAGKEAKRQAAAQRLIDAERATANSFRKVVEAYLADKGRHGGALMKSKTLVKQRLDNHAMPVFGDKAIGDIKRCDVSALLDGMLDTAPVAANRLLGNLKLVWKFAVLKGKLEYSVIADLDKVANENSRDRVLDDDELRVIWEGCNGLGKAQGNGIRLMMLTGARRTEAYGLPRTELRDDEWNLPAERSKNGLPHVWPLPQLALDVIADTPVVDGCKFVFSTDGETAISGYSKLKAKLDSIVASNRAKAAEEELDIEKHSLPRWTFHDLRRTLSTGMNRMGIRPEVVESAINHASGRAKRGVAGTYNRYEYLPERTAALRAWADHVERVVNGKELPSNVARLHGAA